MKPLNHSEIRQTLSKIEKPKAKFVKVENSPTTSYKYSAEHKVLCRISKAKSAIKRYTNTQLQKIQRTFKNSDLKKAKKDLTNWLFDVITEGVVLAFAMHILFHVPFTIWTVIAEGIMIVQIPEYVWRLRHHGETK